MRNKGYGTAILGYLMARRGGITNVCFGSLADLVTNSSLMSAFDGERTLKRGQKRLNAGPLTARSGLMAQCDDAPPNAAISCYLVPNGNKLYNYLRHPF